MTRPVPLTLVGFDFRRASSRWRSRLVLPPEERRLLRDQLTGSASARGLVILNTCNRTEWIVESERPEWAGELLRARALKLFAGLSDEGPAPEPHVHVGEAAARHLFRVAVGLESFMLGEREISSQVNAAMNAARAERALSPLLAELGHACARAVRRVERRTRFRESGRGVPSLACEHLQRHLPEGAVGVVGLGTVGRRVVELLRLRGRNPSHLFNRSPVDEPERRPLTELVSASRELDVLVVATGALEPTIDIAELAEGRDRPLFVLDLGIPHQVRPAEGTTDVVLHDLDDLLVEDVRPADEEGRRAAESQVEQGLQEFLEAWHVGPAGPLLRYLQESRDELGEESVPQLLRDELGDLDERRQRRVLGALRGLILERDRKVLGKVNELCSRFREMADDADGAVRSPSENVTATSGGQRRDVDGASS
ncbi:MAG: hypothetical protein AAF533_13885 [Acidobacteriota bacterium]